MLAEFRTGIRRTAVEIRHLGRLPSQESAARLTAALGDAGPLEGALLVHEYRDVFRLSGALGLLVPLVATIARLLGRRLPQLEP